VARNVITLLNATQALLALYDAETGALAPAQTAGGTRATWPARRIALGEGIIGTAAADGASLCVEDAAHDARHRPSDGPCAGSLLVAPIIDDDEVLGVLVAASERVRAFGARHVACAEALADAAALVLGRACTSHAADADRRQLQTFVATARAMTTLPDPRAVFESIAGGISRIVVYDDALIAAHDPAAHALQVVASQGQRSAHLCDQRVSLSDPQSISARVAQSRQALVYTPDAALDRPGHITEAFLAGEDLALLCVPLLSQDTLRGVITLARRQPFTPDDLRAMNDLAPLVATALANVALVASVKAEQHARTRVLQVISHEIKSPLHTLNGYLDLAIAGAGGPVDERQGQLLQHARASAARLAAQVQDLLLLAYDDAGELPVQLTPVDVRRVLHEAVAAAEIAANAGGVTLHLHMPPVLPVVLADYERLGQVVRNLLNNGLAFTPRGGHIWVEARAGATALEISVADTGCGIAAEHLPHIFDRGYRAPAEPGMPRSKGQGLGLAIVKALVERHGGTVHVLSTPGQGTRFTIALPCGRGAADPGPHRR
jgi:signal transduction histidine kinase